MQELLVADLRDERRVGEVFSQCRQSVMEARDLSAKVASRGGTNRPPMLQVPNPEEHLE